MRRASRSTELVWSPRKICALHTVSCAAVGPTLLLEAKAAVQTGETLTTVGVTIRDAEAHAINP